MCSSDAELARRLGVSPTLLSLMRSHDRAITTDTALKLGEMLKMEARDALELAAIHNDVHGKFRDYLGKALAAGVAAVLVFSYADLPISAMESAANELTILHIVLSTLAVLGMMYRPPGAPSNAHVGWDALTRPLHARRM
jgi:DNA-binding Xre family transcriptional regulator